MYILEGRIKQLEFVLYFHVDLLFIAFDIVCVCVDQNLINFASAHSFYRVCLGLLGVLRAVVCVSVKVAHLCPTLRPHGLWSIQSMEFSRPEYWSGQPFPSPRDLPNPGIEPWCPALQADSFPTELSGKFENSLQIFLDLVETTSG